MSPIFQLDYVNDLLQELSSTSDTDSSGEESGGEENKKEDALDEEDRVEQAKLPQYVSRFKVGVVSCTAGVVFLQLNLHQLSLSGRASKHV